ncbi:MAG TPA: hypothetical protein VNA20_14845 [Frankiaceae bacterium]|nr:hypothetical protein [Frankiaceae bacterium]
MGTPSLRDDATLVYDFDADHDGAVWLARQLCESWLRDQRVRTDAVDDLLVVMTELCTGASEGVVLRLYNTGTGIDIFVDSDSTALVEGPQGDLRLAAALCDEVILRATPERTTVCARRDGVVLPE